MISWNSLLDALSWMSLISGSGFVLIGAIGLLRMPDFYTRLHAASIIDTLGAWLILLGLILQSPNLITACKLITILALLFFASPTTSHVLAKAAHKSGLKPWLGKAEND